MIEEKAEEIYTVHWDGNDKNGQELSGGICFCKLEASDFTEVKKMVLSKWIKGSNG